MAVSSQQYNKILGEIGEGVQLVAVSKIQPLSAIRSLYEMGHRDFGENYVQELVDKAQQLPADIRWHFIGHLQSNKVKYLAPFIHLIQGVDSLKLLKEINKQAKKNHRNIYVLLQVHIAKESTKFGLDEKELEQVMLAVQENEFSHVCVRGLMGMATFTDDLEQVKQEFLLLKSLYDRFTSINHNNVQWNILSMGMSDDYPLAIECGSNMVRIGSKIFGRRLY